jgi:hypothetical protein
MFLKVIKKKQKQKQKKKYKLGKTNLNKNQYWFWPGSISCAIRGTPWSTNSQSYLNKQRIWNNLQDNIIQGPVKILSIRKTDFEIHINLFHGVKIWGYQISDQKPHVEEGQTTQWPKEKGQKEKQWSIKHYIENTSLTKTGDELRDALEGLVVIWHPLVTLFTNPVISHDSEHRKMRAKQQHVCKEMNQYIRSIPTGSGFYVSA